MRKYLHGRILRREFKKSTYNGGIVCCKFVLSTISNIY